MEMYGFPIHGFKGLDLEDLLPKNPNDTDINYAVTWQVAFNHGMLSAIIECTQITEMFAMKASSDLVSKDHEGVTAEELAGGVSALESLSVVFQENLNNFYEDHRVFVKTLVKAGEAEDEEGDEE